MSLFSLATMLGIFLNIRWQSDATDRKDIVCRAAGLKNIQKVEADMEDTPLCIFWTSWLERTKAFFEGHRDHV